MKIRASHQSSGFTWTAELDAILRELHAVGLSARGIADRIGTTRNSVMGRIWRSKLAVHAAARPLDDDEAEVIIAGHAMKRPLRDIAIELGRSYSNVHKHATEMGLRFERKRIRKSRAKGEFRFGGGIRTAPVPVAPAGEVPIEFLGLSIQEIGPHQCRYAHGDYVPYSFCGQPVHGESSWCDAHWRVVFKEKVRR